MVKGTWPCLDSAVTVAISRYKCKWTKKTNKQTNKKKKNGQYHFVGPVQVHFFSVKS